MFAQPVSERTSRFCAQDIVWQNKPPVPTFSKQLNSGFYKHDVGVGAARCGFKLSREIRHVIPFFQPFVLNERGITHDNVCPIMRNKRMFQSLPWASEYQINAAQF